MRSGWAARAGGTAELRAPSPQVTVEMLDHHRRLVETQRTSAGAGETRLRFSKSTEERPFEAMHLHVGASDAWSEITWQGAYVELGKKADGE